MQNFLSASIPREDHDELRRLAIADDRSVSSLVRAAIKAYIKNSEGAGQGASAKTTSMRVLDHGSE